MRARSLFVALLAVVTIAAALYFWTRGPGTAAMVAAAHAQSVSVLSEAEVELRDIGRLEGTQAIYIEFTDGARCIVTDNGAGDVDCDW